MSQKTLSELVKTRLEIEGWYLKLQRQQRPWIAMFDVRIAQAEAAERVAEALATYVIDGHPCGDGAMDAAWKQYVAAREAVRKLEGQADGP